MTDNLTPQQRYNRDYYLKRREELKERSRSYYHANRDDQLQKRAKRYAENPEPAKVRAKAANAKFRQWFQEMKSKLACIECGENRPACLDFHHRDARQKEYNIGSLARGNYSKAKVLKEIDKCDVLCSNCHRVHHKAKR